MSSCKACAVVETATGDGTDSLETVEKADDIRVEMQMA